MNFRKKSIRYNIPYQLPLTYSGEDPQKKKKERKKKWWGGGAGRDPKERPGQHSGFGIPETKGKWLGNLRVPGISSLVTKIHLAQKLKSNNIYSLCLQPTSADLPVQGRGYTLNLASSRVSETGKAVALQGAWCYQGRQMQQLDS